MPLTYNSAIFSVANLSQAKNIILTAESSTTEERWKTETPLLSALIASHHQIGPDMVVLDYGCGIGRMAKELIAKYGCRVIGVDISPSMRALSVEYVNSDSFFACSPAMLKVLIEKGVRVDLAISIWVLQHCLTPATDIGYLRDVLKQDGGLFVVNNIHRAVPTKEAGWANDGIDIKGTIAKIFSLQSEQTLVSPDVPTTLSGSTFWAAFKKGEPF
jgi:cyclopropane fatty-acyl-phospholipid synthase-like methyltransferase